MAHNRAERVREIRRRRAKRLKVTKLKRKLAATKDESVKHEVRQKLEKLGAQVPAA